MLKTKWEKICEDAIPCVPNRKYASGSFFVYSVSAVAQQILWNCLIEDPALVLRHFLEKLTVSNRQVRQQPHIQMHSSVIAIVDDRTLPFARMI